MTAVAGDFYDFIVIDKNRLGILVADVSGHGMPAALISSMLKIALDGQKEFAADPVRVLTGLNQVALREVSGALRYGDVHPDRHGKETILYAGAGHPPLIVRDKRQNYEGVC